MLTDLFLVLVLALALLRLLRRSDKRLVILDRPFNFDDPVKSKQKPKAKTKTKPKPEEKQRQKEQRKPATENREQI